MDATWPCDAKPSNALWYPSMLYGSPGEEALLCGHPKAKFILNIVHHPTLSLKHAISEDTSEDITASWPFYPSKHDIPESPSLRSLFHREDIGFSDSVWESLWTNEEIELLSDSISSHRASPVVIEGLFETDGVSYPIASFGSEADMPVFAANSISCSGVENLYEATHMQHTSIPFGRYSYGIAKKPSGKTERTFALQHVLCRPTAQAIGRPSKTTRGIKGVTQCLRALLRQLLAGTGWIMDSSISKDEATCLVKMLIGPDLESRVMIDLPVENTSHLPTGWKAMHYSTVLAEIMTYHIGSEITKTESEQYISHRRGPYRLSARFKEILAGKPWPPHLPNPEDLRAFGCYREGEAGHKCPGKEYTTITFVQPSD